MCWPKFKLYKVNSTEFAYKLSHLKEAGNNVLVLYLMHVYNYNNYVSSIPEFLKIIIPSHRMDVQHVNSQVIGGQVKRLKHLLQGHLLVASL